jgi:hypothetical protein
MINGLKPFCIWLQIRKVIQQSRCISCVNDESIAETLPHISHLDKVIIMDLNHLEKSDLVFRLFNAELALISDPIVSQYELIFGSRLGSGLNGAPMHNLDPKHWYQ